MLAIEGSSSSARVSLHVFRLFSKTLLGGWEHQVVMQALRSFASLRPRDHASSLNISILMSYLNAEDYSCSTL